MRLTLYSDYSLRLLMYCAQHPDRLVTIQEVAGCYRISRNHLMKVAYQLGCKGYLETVRGRGGGLKLARPADKVGLGAVLRDTEDDFALVDCFEGGTNLCPITPACRLKGALGKALKAWFAVLDEYTLADLAGKHPALTRMLAKAG